MEEKNCGSFPEFPVQSEVVNSDDVRVSKKQITDTGDNSSSAHVLLANDDLLIEILLRLPVISILILKLVSKRWLSLITSPDFIMRRNQIPNVDPPSGLFLERYGSSIVCDFMSLDSRILSRKSPLQTTFNFGSSKTVNDVQILQSCNGLLLCRCWTSSYFDMFYIFNPSTNLFKVLPQHDILNLKLSYVAGGIRMAFDPTKSPYYKVVHAGCIDDDDDDDVDSNIQIQTYSSETGNWSVCSDRFPFKSFNSFAYGIYWNDAIHWLNSVDDQPMHFKLNIVDHDHPILTTIQSPPQPLHWNRQLFESRGCLLYLCRDSINLQELTIYEMMNGHSEWSVKYHVNVDDFILPLPKSWTVCSTIWSIVLGEREEDSFMVIKLSGKVLEYKFLSKTLRKLYDLGSTKHDPSKYQFIASFASV